MAASAAWADFAIEPFVPAGAEFKEMEKNGEAVYGWRFAVDERDPERWGISLPMFILTEIPQSAFEQEADAFENADLEALRKLFEDKLPQGMELLDINMGPYRAGIFSGYRNLTTYVVDGKAERYIVTFLKAKGSYWMGKTTGLKSEQNLEQIQQILSKSQVIPADADQSEGNGE